MVEVAVGADEEVGEGVGWVEVRGEEGPDVHGGGGGGNGRGGGGTTRGGANAGVDQDDEFGRGYVGVEFGVDVWVFALGGGGLVASRERACVWMRAYVDVVFANQVSRVVERPYSKGD